MKNRPRSALLLLRARSGEWEFFRSWGAPYAHDAPCLLLRPVSASALLALLPVEGGVGSYFGGLLPYDPCAWPFSGPALFLTLALAYVREAGRAKLDMLLKTSYRGELRRPHSR